MADDETTATWIALRKLSGAVQQLLRSGIEQRPLRSALLHLAAAAAVRDGVSDETFGQEAVILHRLVANGNVDAPDVH